MKWISYVIVIIYAAAVVVLLLVRFSVVVGLMLFLLYFSWVVWFWGGGFCFILSVVLFVLFVFAGLLLVGLVGLPSTHLYCTFPLS
jgi:hypothetical protein